MKNTTLKPSHKLYNRYEYLAEIYANKLFSSGKIGMDKEDVVQEMKLKIYTSIKGYGKRWSYYKETGLYKPVPLKYYLQTALNNKLLDMMKDISTDASRNSIEIDATNFDYGYNGSEDTKIDFSKKEIEINGVNILQGLKGKEVDAFIMHLKGHSMKNIGKIFKGKIDYIVEDRNLGVKGVINNHLEKLRGMKDDIINSSRAIRYSYQLAEEEA